MTAKRYYSIVSGFSLPAVLLLGSLLFALVNANKAQNTSNPADKLDYAWRAQLFLPFFDTFDYQKSLQLTELLKKADISLADKQEINAMAGDLIDQAIYKSSLNPLNYVAKAELLRAADSQQINNSQIKRNYQHALMLTPDSLKIRDDFATYLYEHQQSEQALTILWGAWGRYSAGLYQNGIIFLTHQLQVNQQVGKTEDSPKIEREINKLLELKKISDGGEFILER
ncbi:MAG: hypothetical protein NTV00_14325 [Methylococcales bacterium]|nr:hypothetical protein [Methylococcales bacterium]